MIGTPRSLFSLSFFVVVFYFYPPFFLSFSACFVFVSSPRLRRCHRPSVEDGGAAVANEDVVNGARGRKWKLWRCGRTPGRRERGGGG